MSFNVTALRYGWVALASLGVITGTTIYVLNNTRQQVKPEDVIEIALGVHERCLATQTSTNPTYSVDSPSIVRTWTDTNGVDVGVTNTIGWHTDRAMMVELDTKIKALVPYYVDTNSVYDGTTNIVMLTVTGLWASLGIGDKTNKFTREPAWTNPISTNWIVNYTSYWPSTSGVPTNVCYTTDYNQVVNYARSWTATGGHVWVTSSNWASEVVTLTNAATYGDYPWQIYVEDLQERYKVLNALKMTKTISPIETRVFASAFTLPPPADPRNRVPYDEMYSIVVSDFTTNAYVVTNSPYYSYGLAGLAYSTEGHATSYDDGRPVYKGWWEGGLYAWSTKLSDSSISTQISVSIAAFAKSDLAPFFDYGSFSNVNRYDNHSYGVQTTAYILVTTISNDFLFFDPHVRIANAGEEIEIPDPVPPDSGVSLNLNNGFNVVDYLLLNNWHFNYCTNKYW